MHADLISFGALVLIAGLLARLGTRFGLPAIPCYMLTGILLGPGTPGPVLFEDPEELALLAVLGLVLLLFHLGVEFPLDQVMTNGGKLVLASAGYIALNVGAGLLLGLAMGWGLPEALVIAGVLGISSSAIVTKLLIELRRLANAETPVILGIIVVEDIFLAAYLALLSPFLAGTGSPGALASDLAISFGFLLVLVLLARFGARLVSMLIGSHEDELLAVLMVGLVVLVAGLSEELGVADAIGALMIGLVVSRTALRSRVERLVTPLRDVFAAVFFVAFGLSIDIGALGAVALPVAVAVVITMGANMAAGVLTARLFDLNQRAAANIACTLVGRGEFALILASLALAAGLDDRVGPFVALYVLVLALLGPLVAANSHYAARLIPDRLLRSGWQYVREETMSASCTHLDRIRFTDAERYECTQCVANGDTWVALRLCTSCGAVNCCNDSPNQHATGHFEQSGHPIIRSLAEGEHWHYCFSDQSLVQPSDRTDADRAGE